MCGSRGKCLVISSSYHTNISFIINPLSYNTTYLSWLATSYSCSPFMVLVWSYHWKFKYPCVLVPLWEWVYNNPRHILGYYCNYCFGEWSTCLDGGFSPFPSSQSTTSGYSYHQRWCLNFDGCCQCWFNSHKYGVVSIDDDNTCSNNGYSGEYTILRRMNIMQWFHPPCYWDVWMFSFSFWFIFYRSCTYHYCTLSTVFFNPLDVYFSLSIACVHNLVVCTSHNDFSVGCYIWSGFLISSTHHS
jgi:hypothetical protein